MRAPVRGLVQALSAPEWLQSLPLPTTRTKMSKGLVLRLLVLVLVLVQLFLRASAFATMPRRSARARLWC